MPHVEVKIVDPVTGETQPIGAIGEFCTRGYHVMLGYFENPDATAAAIDADGWLHTGDLCAMDERGYCTIEGRLKDMIIRGGENIYPRELEELLFAHPKVAEVAVVGLPDEKWGEEVAAFIRPIAGERARQARAVRLRAPAPRAAQDSSSLVRGRRLPDDRTRQDPEVQAPRDVGQRRTDRALGGPARAPGILPAQRA